MNKFKIALAGNPNSGKSTVFNALTGSKQIVGNWAGVTVERKTGYFSIDNNEFEVIDLPGIYSLSSYSIDEQISRDFLLSEKPDLIVAVVDASNLERNLYFVSQLLEMGNKVVIALNMIDVALERNLRINSMALSKLLKIPVVKMVANQEHGIEKLKKAISEHIYSESNILNIDYGQEVENAIKTISSEFMRLLDGMCLNFIMCQ
jgi:ferrous iron transport protein B